MARVKYEMLMGMKEHPETGVLLFPSDVFECEEMLIDPPYAAAVAWKQAVKWDDSQHLHRPEEYALVCARRVSEETPVHLGLRDEASKILGINYDPKRYEREEAQREAQEATAGPRPPVAKEAPASVRRTAEGRRAAAA